jgi:hypothetical protein
VQRRPSPLVDLELAGLGGTIVYLRISFKDRILFKDRSCRLIRIDKAVATSIDKAVATSIDKAVATRWRAAFGPIVITSRMVFDGPWSLLPALLHIKGTKGAEALYSDVGEENLSVF